MSQSPENPTTNRSSEDPRKVISRITKQVQSGRIKPWQLITDADFLLQTAGDEGREKVQPFLQEAVRRAPEGVMQVALINRLTALYNEDKKTHSEGDAIRRYMQMGEDLGVTGKPEGQRFLDALQEKYDEKPAVSDELEFQQPIEAPQSAVTPLTPEELKTREARFRAVLKAEFSKKQQVANPYPVVVSDQQQEPSILTPEEIASFFAEEITPAAWKATVPAAPPPTVSSAETFNSDDIKIGEEVSLEDVEWLQLVGAGEKHEERDYSDVYVSAEALGSLRADLEIRGSHLEAGGLVLGYINTDPKNNRLSTRITRYLSLPENLMPATSMAITFSPDAWRYANEEMDRLRAALHDPQLSIVGWVHSHPGYGAFLSADDHFVNKFFQAQGQVAIVYDPNKEELGVFSKGGTFKRIRSEEDSFRKHRGFFKTSAKTETQSDLGKKKTAE